MPQSSISILPPSTRADKVSNLLIDKLKHLAANRLVEPKTHTTSADFINRLFCDKSHLIQCKLYRSYTDSRGQYKNANVYALQTDQSL